MSRTAMKLALEAITTYLSESPDPSEEAVEGLCDAASMLKKALAEQPAQQEPVAWMQEMPTQEGETRSVRMTTLKEHATLEWGNPIPLYTSPAQRTWVGLTDEEIAQGCKESWVTEQAWQSAVWWAEAKLKEKNK